MLEEKDLNYFRNKLPENEINEILGLYNVILNDPQKRKDLNEKLKNTACGLTTFDIVDSKISVLALMSIIFNSKCWGYYSDGIETMSDRYSRMYHAVNAYILTHATEEDAITYLSYID